MLILAHEHTNNSHLFFCGCEMFPDPGPLPSSYRAVSLRNTTLNSNLRVNAADLKSSDVLHWTTYIWTTSDFIKDVELMERQSTEQKEICNVVFSSQ